MLLGALRDVGLMMVGDGGMKRLCCTCLGGWAETLASVVGGGARTEGSVEGLLRRCMLGAALYYTLRIQ
jgi:hypothetical protein